MTHLAIARLAAVKRSDVRGRSAIAFLAATGEFLFHGSPHRVPSLEPRQAMTYDDLSGNGFEHGIAAVSATPFPDLAIYRALVNPQTTAPNVGSYRSEISVRDDGQPRLAASPDAISWGARMETEGWVYVLDPETFEPFSRIERRAYVSVEPLVAIRVSGIDLPTGVVVLPAAYAAARRYDDIR